MNQDTPKLHGWITPEYAVQIIGELIAFLEKNGIYLMANKKEIRLEIKNATLYTMPKML